MKGYLSNNQINYLLYHLNLVFEITEDIRSSMVFLREEDEDFSMGGKIIFRLTLLPFDITRVKQLNGLPVLFPLSDQKQFYSITGNNLIFEDDLLKSAFFLLSGYQEIVNNTRDRLGRFSAKESVQQKLGITAKPLVNYYFEVIKEGIQVFLRTRHAILHVRSKLAPFGFVLTHDVDRIRHYTINYLIYKAKELLGFRPSAVSKHVLFKQFANALAGYLKLRRGDPAWDFDFLRGLEHGHEIVSVFFFLSDEKRHVDADYRFDDKEIITLIKWLAKEGCEIGLHGSHNSAISLASMQKNKSDLQEVYPHVLKGIRQHRLRYEIPDTAIYQSQLGFTYDTSLGFFDHEGFRNACCTPFKLYDFKGEKMIDLWELPLNVMDCTLLEYRGLDFEEALKCAENLLNEIISFSGVFTLLWHNGYFDEIRFPGIKSFYKKLIQKVMARNPINDTGSGIINKFEKKTLLG